MNTHLDRTTARLAGAALALASALAIAGFTVLGSVFEYPQILEEPTADILALFREHQGAVMTWFLVLVVSAALMAPAGIWLGRHRRRHPRPLDRRRRHRRSDRAGRRPAALGHPRARHQRRRPRPGPARRRRGPLRAAGTPLLGKAIGETLGYALTATFTVLVVIALRRTVLPGWLALRRVRRRGPDRDRRGDPARRRRQPDQLRRLRGLVRLAARRGGRALPGPRPPARAVAA